jgi:UPF0176 protein
MSLRVAAFYRFTPLAEAERQALRQQLLAVGQAEGVKGTVLLAPEGVNGTVSGPEAGVEALLAVLLADPRFADLSLKRHSAAHQAFHRLKVRLKREIVTIGLAELTPTAAAGTYVPPLAWNTLIEQPDTLLIDTRNSYEVAVGSFAGALDPGTESFRDFPDWVERQLRPLVEARRPKALALVCTGGIRCEKAAAYLLQQGFGGVQQLQGGILSYLEEVEPQQSRWQGECFVFDQRVAVNHQLQPGEYSLCHACRMPLSVADRGLASFQLGVSCRHCAGRGEASDRARFSERQRQIDLARRRGEAHIGRVFPPPAAAADG